MSTAAKNGAVAFRTTVLLGGKTGIAVPEDVVATLGTSRRPAVHATIAGYTYRTTVASMRARFMLPISAEVRERAGVAAGAEARRVFGGLSYSNKRRLVLSVEGARTTETRERRIAGSVEALREGRA